MRYVEPRQAASAVRKTTQTMVEEAVELTRLLRRLKRDSAGADLYDLSLYLVLLYEAPHVLRRSTGLQGLWAAPRQAMRAWLSSENALHAIGSELDRAIGTLHHKAQGFEVQISEFGPERLRKSDALRFFRELLNYNPAVVDAARLTHDTHLDYFVSDSAAYSTSACRL